MYSLVVNNEDASESVVYYAPALIRSYSYVAELE